MNDGALGDHHLRPAGAPPDWRRSRSESSGAVDDLETSYVPTAACLPGPHRRHYVNNFSLDFLSSLATSLLPPDITRQTVTHQMSTTAKLDKNK